MADTPEPRVERMFISNFQGMRDGSRVEIRSASDGRSSRTIGGYAAVFGVESRNMGGFQECVMPVFFNKSRAENWPDVVCRYEHNPLYLLGTTRSKTLRVQTDNMGLFYDVDCPESRSDVLEAVGRGDIVHSSFSFLTYEDQWRYSDSGVPLRQLISGKLIDVSPVLQPAYPDATVGLRSLALAKEASLEDVMALSEQNELRKLFIRTDIDGGASRAQPELLVDEPKVDEVQVPEPTVDEVDESQVPEPVVDEPKTDESVTEAESPVDEESRTADRYPDSEGPFAGPNNTFPLNTADRVRNAWARIHQGPTMANHSAAEISDIRAKIKARAKELGIELGDSAERSAPEADETPRLWGSLELLRLAAKKPKPIEE